MTESRQHNLKRSAFLLLKIGIVAAAFWYIWHKLASDNELPAIGDQLSVAFSSSSHVLFGLAAVALMPFNWSIEALKWRYLVRRLDALSFQAALKAVMAGLTVSTFTPNRIGELAGRAAFLAPGQRIRGTLVTAIGTTSQLLLTLIVGSVALLLGLRWVAPDALPMSTAVWTCLFGLTLLSAAALIYLYLRTAALTALLQRISWLQRLERYFEVFADYTTAELATVLRMSLLRYGVFSLQFFLLLRMFDVELASTEALTLIPVSFLVMTIIPTIGLTEVGVREVVAMEVIGLASPNHVGIVAATFTLWLINWLVPSITGSFFVMGAKLPKAA